MNPQTITLFLILVIAALTFIIVSLYGRVKAQDRAIDILSEDWLQERNQSLKYSQTARKLMLDLEYADGQRESSETFFTEQIDKYKSHILDLEQSNQDERNKLNLLRLDINDRLSVKETETNKEMRQQLEHIKLLERTLRKVDPKRLVLTYKPYEPYDVIKTGWEYSGDVIGRVVSRD